VGLGLGWVGLGQREVAGGYRVCGLGKADIGGHKGVGSYG
jgi:hypothetical protein